MHFQSSITIARQRMKLKITVWMLNSKTMAKTLGTTVPIKPSYSIISNSYLCPDTYQISMFSIDCHSRFHKCQTRMHNLISHISNRTKYKLYFPKFFFSYDPFSPSSFNSFIHIVWKSLLNFRSLYITSYLLI